MRIKHSLILGIIFYLAFLVPINSFAAKPDKLISIKGGSYFWTLITHPVEAFSHSKAGKGTCAEQQHCIPRSRGGSHTTTAYWARSNHSVSDRWKNKEFLKEYSNLGLSLLTFGNNKSQENLNAAHRMGAYGLPYTVFFHEY